MRVLFITKTLTKGGSASGARNLLGALRTGEPEVIALDAYAQNRRKSLLMARAFERVFERLIFNAETHCVRFGGPTFDLKALYNEHRPDIIQLCDVSANTIRFADIDTVPCPVVHRMSDFWPYHGAHHYSDQPPEHPRLADWLCRYFVYNGSSQPDCRIAPSHWLANQLGGAHNEIILNAVTIPAHVRPRRVFRDPIRLGFISANVLDPRKGFTTLPPFIDALHQHSDHNVELHVFGRLPKNFLAGFKRARVVYHPPFTPENFERAYNTFDILLCPSRRDNSPNVVTEALAHGVPVIGQSGTGIDSYVNERMGALVDFQTVDTASIQHFVDSLGAIVAAFPEFSDNAYNFACNELAATVICAQYVSLYKRLIAQRANR